MTEALAFIVLFVGMLAGLIFVFQIHTRKLEVKGEARELAWAHALGSCEGDAARTDPGSGAALDDVLEDPEAGNSPELDQDGEQLFDEANQSGELELGESWGVATARAERPAVSVLDFQSQPITGEMRVQCDEKPRGADPVSVLGFLWDLRNTVNFQ
jgi:hypothetical protein